MSALEPAAEPRRRLSFLRITLVVVVAAAVASAPFAFRTVRHKLTPAAQVSSFAPYVDVTATPQYAFEDPTVSTAGSVVLGFVVSSTSVACQPSWGTAYSLTTAATGIDLDRRIARLRQRGGQVTVSFGGVSNSELAMGCTDTGKLAAAYQTVVSRYGLTSVDFDIEDASAPAAVAARRAAAVKRVQDARAAAGKTLSVWLTLPVGPDGLTSAGVTVLDAMLSAKVTLAGVNALTMDYSTVTLAGVNALTMDYGNGNAGRTMRSLTESALTALAGQVATAYAKVGTALSEEARWRYVGATPMIGQNDTADEQFELADAKALLTFARAHHLRQLSMWSANRDKSCGVNYTDPTVVSDSCSGVSQSAGAYAKLFNAFTDGGGVTASGTATAAVAASDNPSTSPYPIWNAQSSYAKNSKVVWHRNVYIAKWWTQGDTPDAPVTNEADTPWTLIGPVLSGETPAASTTLAAGTYPTWSPTHTYVAGDRVQYDGVGYQAKWWTQGDQPGARVSDPSDTPWQVLSSS
jgi:chitinase